MVVRSPSLSLSCSSSLDPPLLPPPLVEYSIERINASASGIGHHSLDAIVV